MSKYPSSKGFSRRTLLRSLSLAPAAFSPAPLNLLVSAHVDLQTMSHPFDFADFRITPHYPAKVSLDDVVRFASPGTDAFVNEKYAFEIEKILQQWAKQLQAGSAAVANLKSFCAANLSGSTFGQFSERKIRDRQGIAVVSRTFTDTSLVTFERFADDFQKYLEPLLPLKAAEFQTIAIRQKQSSPLQVEAEIRYTLIGEPSAGGREQRIGTWNTEWVQHGTDWRVTKWIATTETVCRAKQPLFAEITAQALAGVSSYKDQMLRGADYWRTVLDGAVGVDVYGNQGIAVGDFDGDGFDDIYVCQPSGLPNRLYRNRGDGTFEDVSEHAGVDVLDATSCALFADFENRGHQDLLVVTNAGPLLFVNEGEHKFTLEQDAFKFARPPQGTFTHAALADYDRDGRLDVYFCLYNYYAGLDQYRYPSPYFDARNGPANFLFRNEGNWSFADHTDASGLNVDNDRYSFACAWGDANGDGWPDLYVANDFGRSNLYRNNGDGTFTSIAAAANVEDVGAGMSACWLDCDGDGQQDVYVANMWSAAGLRVSTQDNFHSGDPEEIRALYRRHARGNSLYKNLGNGKFHNAASDNGAEYGGWAWSSDSWDFDHDGHPDIYVANGYISGDDRVDLASFFWRQVVGNSPARLSPAANYEHGWNAINEMIRSDRTWNGHERSVLYCNNGDGTFSDVSGISGIDFSDDSRAFALSDFDHDGRPEVLLKNRNAPQLRMLRNTMPDIGNSVAFRLRGTKSNRDAIGAAITVEAGSRKQTKYLQAGSGFLSQHTKEVSFGVADASGFVKATIRWPSGTSQVLDRVPVNHRASVEEGSPDVRATAFSVSPLKNISVSQFPAEKERDFVETWLVQPLRAPGFSLPDTAGKTWDLHSVTGNKLLTFYASTSAASREQLTFFREQTQSASLPKILCVCVDDAPNVADLRSVATAEALTFPLLLSTPEVTGTYNIVFRYLFDRHRDLGVPTSFLIDGNGLVVKVYQGVVDPRQVAADSQRVARSPADRQKQGLPFPGTLHLGNFQRNDFTYGVAFFQRGYLEAATDAFKQVIASKPDDAEAHYNLGTLYLQRKDLSAARDELAKTVGLKPSHAQAWNNLGMIAAQENQIDEAVQDFQRCLAINPSYATGLLNLGNVYRREKHFSQAEQLLTRAREIEPENPEVNYSLAMLYAQQNQIQNAEESFDRALKLRPDYPDALNNYGVLLVREQRYAEAEDKFRFCIQSNPNFDQAYVNLSRLYALLNEKQKAREVLQSLLRLQPEHAVAQQMLKVLQ